MLPIHKELSKLDLNKTQMGFDVTSLYPSGMWDHDSVYFEKESGFCFKPVMIKFYVEAFKKLTFNQDGKESAIFRLKHYNPPKIIFQHPPLKEEIKNTEVNRMGNG